MRNSSRAERGQLGMIRACSLRMPASQRSGSVGLAQHEVVHLGVGQDQEPLLGDGVGDDVGDLLGLEHDARRPDDVGPAAELTCCSMSVFTPCGHRQLTRSPGRRT